MLARTGVNLQIDPVHARAICDEIGDRLSGLLRRQISDDLPPRLRYLMEELAEAVQSAACEARVRPLMHLLEVRAGIFGQLMRIVLSRRNQLINISCNPFARLSHFRRAHFASQFVDP